MKLNLYLFSPLCFAAVLLFCANFAYAQTPVYLLDSNYTTPPIVDCNGILLDSGGNSGHYDQSDNYTIVISPPTSGCVALHLDSLNLTGNTTFTIYNGTTAGPRLAELNALSNNQTALFTAESGVMIIVFRADLLVAPGRGFAAHWECLADCSTVSPCSATIYDPQANGNYLPNQQIVTTYCPDGPNKRMKIDFSLFRLASGDTLKVYDGNSTAAPLLQSLTGFNNATYNPLATNTNTQGCLTLAFSSDTASEDAGYMGKLTCQRACQTITPSFMINATVPTYPTVAGDSAVNICTWQLLEVTAAAIYPQNDSIYHQNDSTTRYVFYWNDGTKTVTNGAPPHKAWHQYENGRIYFPRIIATDPDSLCGEISPPNFRVRVVSDPVFSNQQLPPICLGDTMQLFPLAVTVNDLLTGSFPEQLIANNTMICLPDGSSTISTILAENFNPAALSQVEHIKAVYANFEHSYAGDLKIELICPSGNSIILKNYPGSVGGGGGNYFGIANDMLSTCTEPAQGLNYGWAGPNLTTISGIPTSIANSTYQGIGGVSIPYTMPLLDTLTMNDVFTMGTHLISVSNPYMNMNSQTLQPAFYKPFQPMSLLDGCPVNGEWKLKITDNLGIDNGILYNWGIIFDDSLYPISEAYTPLYSQSWICNSTTVGSNCAVGTPTGSTSMTVVPTANINGYIYSLQYTGFPCSFYPYVSVTVKPLPAAPILSPTVICPGFSTDLVANPAICGGTSPYRPNSMNTTPFLIPDDSISFLINAIPVNLDTACHFKLKAVRLNGLAHQYYPDLRIWIQSPTGVSISLLSGGVGAATVANSVDLEFRQGAANISNLNDIVSGTYQPMGFLDLYANYHTPLNGLWRLKVHDKKTGNTGTLNSWGLTFETPDGNNYNWSTGEQTNTISVSPTVTTNYTVTVSALNQCTNTASTVVTVDGATFTITTTSTPDTAQLGNGTATASLYCSSSSASYSYQWSNGAITPMIMGLIAGVYTVTVTSSTGATYTAQVVVGSFTKIDNYDDNTISIALQPNPTEGSTLLKAVFETPTASTLLIYNNIGQLIYSKENAATSNLEQAISLETQSAGVYFISLKTSSGLLTQRLVLIR